MTKLTIAFLLFSVSCSAQITLDSLIKVLPKGNKVVPCSNVIQADDFKTIDFLDAQIIAKVKELSVASYSDTCTCNILVSCRVNCKGEIGDWTINTPNSYKFRPCEVVFVTELMNKLLTLQMIKVTKDMVSSKVKVILSQGKLTVK